jgi:hypothetical protein
MVRARFLGHFFLLLSRLSNLFSMRFPRKRILNEVLLVLEEAVLHGILINIDF